MDCGQTCSSLADHRLNEGGVHTALPAVLPGATRTASGAKSVHAVIKVALQAEGFVLCFALSQVPAEDGAGHGTEPVGITLRFGVNRASGLAGLGSGWPRRGSAPPEGLECQGAQCPANSRCKSV